MWRARQVLLLESVVKYHCKWDFAAEIIEIHEHTPKYHIENEVRLGLNFESKWRARMRKIDLSDA